MQTDFLTLDFTRITRDQTGFGQRGLELGVEVDQRTCQAVAHRAGLTRLAATIDVHHHVKARQHVHQHQRLTNHHLAGFTGEELIHWLAIDNDVALTGLDENTRDSALAPAGAIVVFANHCVISSVLGCCATCG